MTRLRVILIGVAGLLLIAGGFAYHIAHPSRTLSAQLSHLAEIAPMTYMPVIPQNTIPLGASVTPAQARVLTTAYKQQLLQIFTPGTGQIRGGMVAFKNTLASLGNGRIISQPITAWRVTSLWRLGPWARVTWIEKSRQVNIERRSSTAPWRKFTIPGGFSGTTWLKHTPHGWRITGGTSHYLPGYEP